jgi:aspartate-semialdehyde dehydrogenase
VTFDCLGIADLHDGHVAACTSDVTDVEEVVASETFFGYLSLFALMAVVESDESSGRAIRRVDLRSLVAFDDDVVVVVPAVNLKLLVVRRFIMDGKSVRLDRCVVMMEMGWTTRVMKVTGA